MTSLQGVIDAVRKAAADRDEYDWEALDMAIRYLDRDVDITFAGKHFAVTGFDVAEDDVAAEIEQRGGILHNSMVKKADYLVACLGGPGAAKVKKALEWREKGAKNQIVSDYQLWQATLGIAPGEAPQANSDAKEEKRKSSRTRRRFVRYCLKANEGSGRTNCKGENIGREALKEQEERKKREAEEQARQEQAGREREEAERRRIEAQKAAERTRIQKEISDLSQEMASLTGLFAGIKRRKLQRRIDESKEQFRRL